MNESFYDFLCFLELFSDTDVFVTHYYQWKVVNDKNDVANIDKNKDYVIKSPIYTKRVSQYIMGMEDVADAEDLNILVIYGDMKMMMSLLNN